MISIKFQLFLEVQISMWEKKILVPKAKQLRFGTKSNTYLRGSRVLSPTYATAAKCITASNEFSENILLT